MPTTTNGVIAVSGMRTANTVTISGDLILGRIDYGAMQLTWQRVWGEYTRPRQGRRAVGGRWSSKA